jgi:hypothetical protein
MQEPRNFGNSILTFESWHNISQHFVSYTPGKTRTLHYNNQPINSVYRNNRCLMVRILQISRITRWATDFSVNVGSAEL